jgi:hypothetical protein
MPQAVTAHPPAIAIKGHATRTPISAKEGDDGFQGGFRVKIRTDLGLEPGGRSGIHKIEYLHHMLLLAVGIRRHTGRILEIELNLFQRIGTLLPAARTMRCIQDTSDLPQDAPDRACGARKREMLRLQLLVTREVVENCSRPWRPVEVLRRVFANLHNVLDDTRMDLWIRGVMGPRVREQHLQIIGGSYSQSLEPLLDPAQATAEGGGSILLGPRKACSWARLRRLARSAIHSTSMVSLTHVFFLQCGSWEVSQAISSSFFLMHKASSLAC